MVSASKWSVLLILFLIVPVWGYERSTHEKLTGVAVDRSVLSSSEFLKSIGLFAYGANRLRADDETQRLLSIRDLAMKGSSDEDIHPDPLVVTKHFFNPQAAVGNQGLQVGLVGSSALNFLDSRTWALHQSPLHSYRSAMGYYKSALIEPSPASRSAAFGLLFSSLGHIVHHIQDMAQPQHTRNDVHCNVALCVLLSEVTDQRIYTPSLYELYTADHNDQFEQILHDNLNHYPVSAKFSDPEDYWQVDGPGAPDFDHGMAGFTSARFVTSGSNYLVQDNGVVTTPVGLPLPGAEVVSGTPFIEPCNFSGSIGSVAGQCKYFAAHITDPIRSPQNVYMQKFVAESITNHVLASGESFRRFVLDLESYKERWNVLLPRAVSYSTGLIDQFFRAEIDFRQIGNELSGLRWRENESYSFAPNYPARTYRLTNKSSEAIEGFVRFFYEDLAGTRTEFGPQGSGFAVDLAANGGFMDFELEPPPPEAQNYIAVFEGAVGDQAGVVGGYVRACTLYRKRSFPHPDFLGGIQVDGPGWLEIYSRGLDNSWP
ncbi:MAG: hypothetical protein KJP03_04830, partial [Gammaproteobacteria bacterium]|nr:hypothetical protein [Gammaproteobacteria bacterium]